LVEIAAGGDVGRSSTVVCLIVAAVLALTAPVRAATCAPPRDAEARVGDIDGRYRLQWIDRRLDAEASKARFWARAWAIGIGAGGVGSLAAVPFVAPSDRVDWYTGAVTAAIGVVPFLVSPLSVTRDAPKLHAALATLVWDDDARVCASLVDAERWLAAAAADERWQRGWWTHAGNIAFNTGVLLFLGFGYHHWTSGIINGAAGAAVGEAIILTQPTGSIEDLRTYARGDFAIADGRREKLTMFYMVWAGPGTTLNGVPKTELK
jgi:hypothetical protein